MTVNPFTPAEPVGRAVSRRGLAHMEARAAQGQRDEDQARRVLALDIGNSFATRKTIKT